ncbi:hypothetical protein ACPC54_37195 [Kitasatospora sp. NPDC094028]
MTNPAPPTTTALTATHIERWAAPFGDLVDTLSRRVVGHMRPSWQSPASCEIAQTSTLLRSDGTPWGVNPASTTLAVTELLLRAALEHADAVRTLLLLRPRSVMSIETLVRNALEAAAQAWWLLEPGIGSRQRVVRRLLLQRQTANALEKSAAKMGYAVSSDYGKTVADTDQDRAELMVKDDFSTNGNWVGAEGQRPLGYTERVARFMEQTGQTPRNGPYAFVSGTAHAELWRIYYSYTWEKDSAGADIMMPHAPAEFVRFAVSVCTDAVAQPAIRAFQWLDQGAALAEISRLRDPIRAAMKP